MTPAAAKAAYRRALPGVGETVTIRRYSGVGNARAVAASAEVRARVVAGDGLQLVGQVQETRRKVIILAEDLAAAAVTLPLRPTDRLAIRGEEVGIVSIDDNTRRVAGELIAYELTVRG